MNQQLGESHASALTQIILVAIMDDPDDDHYEYVDDDDPVDDVLDELTLSATCQYLGNPLRYRHSDLLQKINIFYQGQYTPKHTIIVAGSTVKAKDRQTSQ
ncbi:hypothetical protein BG000_006254, partial [Podila horticola]